MSWRAIIVGVATVAALPTRADDREKIAALLAPAVERGGGVVTIPPGEYALDGDRPLPIPSRTVVWAYGARFVLPAKLGERARAVLFEGTDVREFAWHGGEFAGHVFDPDRRENAWEPSASTRAFVIHTSAGGPGTADVRFRDVRSSDVAGAVVTVEGALGRGEAEVGRFAERVTVEDCTLLRSGKFMWDYGYLWQQVGWPEEYEAWEVDRAWRYFRRDLVREGVTIAAGEDRVRFDNRARPVKVSAGGEPREAVCFFGAGLPPNLVRGRQYFVVESGAGYVKVAERPGGAAVRFDRAATGEVRLVTNLLEAYLALYAPEGAGPGKGAVDLVGCRDVRLAGCRLSALGDTMHVQRSRNVVIAGNQIVGSRMGAFFLAEHCRNAVVTGNTVDGTNGSRVVSVEKSCADVTITGNTFRGGGRGSWVNQPTNLVLTGNVFVDNTTKNARDPRRGRRSFVTGDYETKPELYVTLYERGGAYGPVIVRDNIFRLGAGVGAPAVTLAAGGRGVVFRDNTFVPAAAAAAGVVIRVDPSTDADVRDNVGATVERAAVEFDHGRR